MLVICLLLLWQFASSLVYVRIQIMNFRILLHTRFHNLVTCLFIIQCCDVFFFSLSFVWLLWCHCAKLFFCLHNCQLRLSSFSCRLFLVCCSCSSTIALHALVLAFSLCFSVSCTISHSPFPHTVFWIMFLPIFRIAFVHLIISWLCYSSQLHVLQSMI